MADPKRVVLIDPNGNEFNAAHPSEITNLVFGSGYRIKDRSLTVDSASALLAEKGPVADQLGNQNPPVVEAPKK